MIPEKIKHHKGSNQLELVFNQQSYQLSAEYLRISSPSAEVKGHGPGQAKLQFGKRLVELKKVEPVGSYALKLVFSDGHDSGIYTWSYLYELASQYPQRWQDYLAQLHSAQKTRDPDTSVVKFIN
ncbi:DUF971 domain-containing protein [Simiduia curdlanivorans]|uniref:DUF971 domain-containing protein n=1 Tax=Simiduia curdlanivorans TaxID=1492769 RepID=A0ABV8V2C4_9GAMM|nr:DUF971 domain-containing protein [Simiduia curdlanivorans]MDN3637307.1 DUF971 domain-containing protein [Simiduia curdlanivorans]